MRKSLSHFQQIRALKRDLASSKVMESRESFVENPNPNLDSQVSKPESQGSKNIGHWECAKFKILVRKGWSEPNAK